MHSKRTKVAVRLLEVRLGGLASAGWPVLSCEACLETGWWLVHANLGDLNSR